MNIESCAVIIPSYEPDEKLTAYCKELKNAGFGSIIVIDDGSDAKYQSIFEGLDVEVVHHDVNLGKGAGLKTGYTHVLNNHLEIQGIVTADSDGQHTVEDCKRVADTLSFNKRQLILGTRNFDLSNIPPKSRNGNKITSIVFKLLYGKYLPDTQTGLRAFDRGLLEFMINVDGQRYEYEMNVLIQCARHNISMVPIEIETIYENNNERTHFHPIKDSWRIYKVILGSFFIFMGSSIISTIIDHVVFNFVNILVFHNQWSNIARYVLWSTVIARVISATCNYTMNRKYVFESNDSVYRSALKYFGLCLVIIFLSAGGTWLLSHTGISNTISKIIVDTILYVISYRVQELWVFRTNNLHT